MVSLTSSNCRDNEIEGRKVRGRGGRGDDEARHARKAVVPPATDAIATCVTVEKKICTTPDLLLKHPDETFATYI
jgi:hypothetical protein